MLILNASDDIALEEINNIASQISLYKIKPIIRKVTSFDTLFDALYTHEKFDYIYLATHGCDTSFGNISGTVLISWVTFAAMICRSDVANEGAIFLHSCCRGGLNQVAYQMFGCCGTIEFVCGPRHDVFPVDLITAFNLFLYNIEVKKIDPVRSAEKVLVATDIRLVCFDKLETCVDYSYTSHCVSVEKDIDEAFKFVGNKEHSKMTNY